MEQFDKNEKCEESKNIELIYIREHHWGVYVNGELHKEFDNFDDAADEYEALGGVYPE